MRYVRPAVICSVAGANAHLRALLKAQGFALSHSFMSVLHTRVLRPGSQASHDAQMLAYLNAWRELEDKAGYEIALNIFAHTQATQELPDASVIKVFERFCKIQGMLWQRGNAIRRSVLSYYNPFKSGNNLTERLLLSSLFQQTACSISISESDWLAQLHHAITQHGFAELHIPREARHRIVEVISLVQVTPIEYFGLHLYPRESAVDYQDGNLVLRFELVEALL